MSFASEAVGCCCSCGADDGYDKTYQRCGCCGRPYFAGDKGLHWLTKKMPPRSFFASFGLDPSAIANQVSGGVSQVQSAISTAQTVASKAGSVLSSLPNGLPGASSMISSLSSVGPISSSIGSSSQAITQGDSIINAATSAAGDASSPDASAAIAAAAQCIVSELPPSQATTLIGDAVAGAGTGAGIGAAIGTIFFPALGTAAFGAMGAEVGAEIGLVIGTFSELEADHWNVVAFLQQLTSSGVGAGAAAGAAAGSFIPGVGTAIGAGLGALVGALGGGSTAPQVDYRYSGERLCFPAIPPIPGNGSVNSSGYYGVVPGTVNLNPRCKPNSTFFQTQAGPNANWSMTFAFLVTWLNPSKSTESTRAAAWALAQYYCRSFSKRMGHDTSMAVSWDTVVSAFSAVYPKSAAQRAAAALKKLYQWYGNPALFNTLQPYALWGGVPQNVQNNSAGAMAIALEFATHPLDYLYFPIGVKHDLSNNGVFLPASPKDWTDVFLTPDMTVMTLSEGAVLDISHAAMFHMLIQMSRGYMKARLGDSKIFPGLDVRNHRNFSRCLGHISATMKATGQGLTPKGFIPKRTQSRSSKIAGEAAFGASMTPMAPTVEDTQNSGWNFKIYTPAIVLSTVLIGMAVFGKRGRQPSAV